MTDRRVVSGILFSPRGGSAHAARALNARLPGEGWDTSLVAGSRRDAGPAQDARAFYGELDDLSVVDFTTALASPAARRGADAPLVRGPSRRTRPRLRVAR